MLRLSRRYVDRLKQSLNRINKRKELAKLKGCSLSIPSRIGKEKDAMSSHPAPFPQSFRLTRRKTPTSQPRGSQEVVSLDGKGKGAPSAPGKSPNTMVVRLIPASEAMNNALKSYRYCPLLEVRVAASSQS